MSGRIVLLTLHALVLHGCLVDLSLAAESFFDLKAMDATGAEVSFQQYRGKVR